MEAPKLVVALCRATASTRETRDSAQTFVTAGDPSRDSSRSELNDAGARDDASVAFVDCDNNDIRSTRFLLRPHSGPFDKNTSYRHNSASRNNQRQRPYFACFAPQTSSFDQIKSPPRNCRAALTKMGGMWDSSRRESHEFGPSRGRGGGRTRRGQHGDGVSTREGLAHEKQAVDDDLDQYQRQAGRAQQPSPPEERPKSDPRAFRDDRRDSHDPQRRGGPGRPTARRFPQESSRPRHRVTLTTDPRAPTTPIP